MTENKPISKSRDKLYRVVIILIVAAAAYSNVTKELGRLQEMVGGAHEFTEAGLGGLARVYAATRSLSESARSTGTPEITSAKGHDWNDPIATGGSIEIKGLDENLKIGPADSRELVLANNTANTLTNPVRRSDQHALDVRGVDFLERFTAKALYPSSKLTRSPQKSSCELANEIQKEIHFDVADSEVSRRVLDKVPVGLALLERAVKGEIARSTLPETVIANMVNRRIKITKRGNPRPRINNEALPKLDNAEWPDAIGFKKAARALSLDPAAITSTEMEVEMFKREVSPDVQPLSPPKMSYRYVNGESEMSDSN